MLNPFKAIRNWMEMFAWKFAEWMIKRAIARYLDPIFIEKQTVVRWKLSIGGLRADFSAKLPANYNEMGKVLIMIGTSLTQSETEGRKDVDVSKLVPH